MAGAVDRLTASLLYRTSSAAQSGLSQHLTGPMAPQSNLPPGAAAPVALPGLSGLHEAVLAQVCICAGLAAPLHSAALLQQRGSVPLTGRRLHTCCTLLVTCALHHGRLWPYSVLCAWRRPVDRTWCNPARPAYQAAAAASASLAACRAPWRLCVAWAETSTAIQVGHTHTHTHTHTQPCCALPVNKLALWAPLALTCVALQGSSPLSCRHHQAALSGLLEFWSSLAHKKAEALLERRERTHGRRATDAHHAQDGSSCILCLLRGAASGDSIVSRAAAVQMLTLTLRGFQEAPHPTAS